MLRRTSIIVILLTTIFFAFGWYPVRKGWIEQQSYLATAGIVGSLASIVGLMSLVRSPLGRSDFQNVEWESIKKIADSEKQIQELEGRKAKAHSELEQLTRTRKELADLVKKASTVLFIREELERTSQKLTKFLQRYPAFQSDLENYLENTRKLIALNEEVQHHPDAILITEVLSRARSHDLVREKELLNTVERIPLFGPAFKVALLVFDSLARAFGIIMK